MNTKKLITLSPRNIEMMDEIMAQTGWDNPTQILRRGLEELYKQTMILPFKYKNPTGDDTPDKIVKKAENKALAKKAGENVALQAKLAPKLDMCVNLFGGEVISDETGPKICKYTTYSLNGDYEQRMPIMQVDPIIAKNSLFAPTQDLIFQERPDIRKKFSKLSFYKDK